jgi:hypothetical protein
VRSSVWPAINFARDSQREGVSGMPLRVDAPRGPRSSRAGMLAVALAGWSFLTEPVYGAIAERRLTLPIGEAVVFVPLTLALAALSFRGGRRSLRTVSILSVLLAIGEIPAGIFATTDPSLWWKLDPDCGIVYCGLLHTLAHWSHVPFLVAIALAARGDGATRA